MNTTDTPDWTPNPAGWYTVVVLDDDDTIYAYFTDPDSYTAVSYTHLTLPTKRIV